LLDFDLLYFVCILGTNFILPPISLERALQVLVGKDRKSKSRDYFSVLASSSLHRFDRALHMMLFLYSIFFNNNKKKREKLQDFFLAYQIITCVFA
jgi:hypothetical protein